MIKHRRFQGTQDGAARKENATGVSRKEQQKSGGTVFFHGINYLRWIAALAIGCLGCVLWISRRPPFESPRPKYESKQHFPWDSRPPDAIPLFQADQPEILRRHHCISKIQEWQIEALKPYLSSNKPTSVKNPQLLLVDPAYHENVGDHMITVAEHQLLIRLGWDVNLYIQNNQHDASQRSDGKYQECHYMQAGEFVPPCKEVIHNMSTRRSFDQSLSVWHGGGNWGDLWKSVQKVRIEQSFQALRQSNFTIFGMPQSLYYREKEVEAYDARLLKRGLQKGEEASGRTTFGVPSPVVLSWRENESYTKAQQLYPYVKHLLIPDGAFQLGPYNWRDFAGASPTSKQVDFLLLLRRDHESTVFPATKDRDDDDGEQKATAVMNENAKFEFLLDAVTLALKKSGHPESTFRIVDWPDRLHLFQNDDPFFTKTAIQLLSMGRVVICDRLHAAILAFLSGIPFVYLDQSTGKISKSFRVALDVGGDACNSSSNVLWFSKGDNLTDAIQKGGEVLTLQG